jgi:hypothetical protein
MQFTITGKGGNVIIDPGIPFKDGGQVDLGALFLSGGQGGFDLVKQSI